MSSTEAHYFCKDGPLSCDEFMAFWQDKKLRTQIYREAWLCAKRPEDYEDLRQEAWAEICQLPTHATFVMAERAAHRAIQRVSMREKRRKK